jgi:POT family proton-dependent oligopeptide transporter
MTKDPTSELAPAPAGAAAEGSRVSHDTSFFGHPRGLATLFFTELWERFSYYGMRALLILFMTAAATEGGLGFSEGKSAAIYGLYTAGVYLFALPGGWLADRLFGQQRSVFLGGVIIAAGHFSMALPALGFPEQPPFFAGLILIVLGTGLLKPNISAIVGELYAEGDERRDAGFSIFYMGINLGAILAPLVCGYLGEKIDWHLGFVAAGIGMVAGLIQYKIGQKNLGSAGTLRTEGLDDAGLARQKQGVYKVLGGSTLLILAFVALLATGILAITIEQLANYATVVIVSAAILFFLYIFIAGRLDGTEKKRVGAVAMLFLFSALFWAGFEQAGSSMNIFARDLTDRVFFGWEFPASWLQVVNPTFIVLLAPVFAALWTTLGRRNPTIPIKFGSGLVLLGLGFLVVSFGAQAAEAQGLATPWFLITAYLLHTCGELCISPVGLSTVTKLAPRRFASQMMGVWFISISLGNLLAGLVAGRMETLAMEDLFFAVAVATAGGGLLLFVISPLVNKLTGGMK